MSELVDPRFLKISPKGANPFFLIQHGISAGSTSSRIIIGFGDGSGGSGGIKKSVGTQLTDQLGDRPIIVARATSLGTLLLTHLYNKVKTNLVIPIRLKSEGKILDPPIHGVWIEKFIAVSKTLLTPRNESTGVIIRKESVKAESHFVIRQRHKVESYWIPHNKEEKENDT